MSRTGGETRRICACVDFMRPLAGLIRRLPRGYQVNGRLLVADYRLPGLSGAMLKEWSSLDKLDMLAPRYDRPARIGTMRGWAAQAHLQDVVTESAAHGNVLRATLPAR
jgi:hypothetical protein